MAKKKVQTKTFDNLQEIIASYLDEVEINDLVIIARLMFKSVEIVGEDQVKLDFGKPAPKINIEDLFTHIQRFQTAQRQGISSIREPNEWQKRMDEAQEEFKRAIGPLADHIDWTKRD